MDYDRYQRLKQVFMEAIGREGDARKAFVDTLCGADVELRGSLLELLAEHDALVEAERQRSDG